MDCLILGGAGFIGRHSAEALLRAGHRVRIFDREGCRLENISHLLGDLELCFGDFSDEAALDRALQGMTAVLHLIGTTIAQTSNENPVYDVETNVVPTIRLLSLAADRGVRRVIFSSSGGTVYGIPQEDPIQETHPTDPICAYGISKLSVEKYLALYQRLTGIEYVVLRISNPYGEGGHTLGLQGIINVFLRKAHRGSPVDVWGDGRVVRDYVYAGDVGTAFLRALETRSANNVYNIGSGKGLTILDLIAAFREVLGVELDVRFTPSRPFDVPSNVLDVRKADRLLPWKPSTPLERGLRRTWEWIRGET
jgi:UDP-glucose 4-epimerase